MNILDKFHFKNKKTGIITTMEICDSFARSEIEEISADIPTKTSQLQNDSGFITSAAVPTKTSQLQNDSGFITSAAVPTKTSELQNDSGFITSAAVPTKTSELQNDSGFTTFDGNYNSLSNKPTIPSNVSQLNNDSHFIPQDISLQANAASLSYGFDYGSWKFRMNFPDGTAAEIRLTGSNIEFATYANNTWTTHWTK